MRRGLVLFMRSWIFATGPSFGCSGFFGRRPDFFFEPNLVLFLPANCTVHRPRSSAAKHTAFWSSTQLLTRQHQHQHQAASFLNWEMFLPGTAGLGDTRSRLEIAIWIDRRGKSKHILEVKEHLAAIFQSLFAADKTGQIIKLRPRRDFFLLPEEILFICSCPPLHSPRSLEVRHIHHQK